MGKGSGKRPRAAHVTKEQYDANYEAIFRSESRDAEQSDSPDHGTTSGVSKDAGGQPDRQAEETVEGEAIQ